MIRSLPKCSRIVSQVAFVLQDYGRGGGFVLRDPGVWKGGGSFSRRIGGGGPYSRSIKGGAFERLRCTLLLSVKYIWRAAGASRNLAQTFSP